ncbi:MAG: hypothetical protein WCO52_00660 [bacterium]
MAAEQGLVEGPVDHTPYAGCSWVAAIVVAYLIVVGLILLQLGSIVKHSRLFHLNLVVPTTNGVNANDDFLNQIKQNLGQSVQNSADQAKEQAGNAAKDAIQKEADKQVQAQIDAAKKAAASQIPTSTP